MEKVLEIVISIIVIIILGSLLHFTYDWSKHNKIVALFAAVNESSWEHMKIGLVATLVWSLYDGGVYLGNENYFIAKTLSILVFLFLVPALFYGFLALTKKHFLMLDIAWFCIAIILQQLVFYYIIEMPPIGAVWSYLSIVGLFVIFGFCMIASLVPPKNFLFKDPITSRYGLDGHNKDKHSCKKHNH